MAAESHASGSTAPGSVDTAGHEASPLDSAPPPGFRLRRAATVGQPSQIRRRLTGNNPPPSAENNNNYGFSNIRRRSSTYSEYLETSADELLNPSKSTADETKKSPFVHIPLVSALLPAIAGIFFDNGADFFSDLILLAIAGIFLRWSVTQPWDWYHSAQQVRVVQDEILGGSVFESDSDLELESVSESPAAGLEDVPEGKGKEKETEMETETETKAGTRTRHAATSKNRRWEMRREAAIRELYVHELLALAWCFMFPMLAAYMLHTIRSQLSRPREGLVSDYNLVIFLCAAEVRPVSHLIRMIQQRTLHVQRIVKKDPYVRASVTGDRIQALCDRLEALEARGPVATPEASPSGSNGAVQQPSPEALQKMVESAVSRELRKAVQPELEALSRAMRRYEKKLNLLTNQSDHRIEYVEYRLNDAIALAAVAAKNSSNSQWALTGWLVEKLVTLVMFPLQAVGAVLTFPFRTASTLFRSKEKLTPEKGNRSLRNGRPPIQMQGRGGSDRLGTRVSRR
jgi:hypothetical protein